MSNSAKVLVGPGLGPLAYVWPMLLPMSHPCGLMWQTRLLVILQEQGRLLWISLHQHAGLTTPYLNHHCLGACPALNMLILTPPGLQKYYLLVAKTLFLAV